MLRGNLKKSIIIVNCGKMSSEITKYEVIIYWSEDDSCFVAEVPELAGCMSNGPTPHDTLTNVQVIIDE